MTKTTAAVMMSMEHDEEDENEGCTYLFDMDYNKENEYHTENKNHVVNNIRAIKKL